MTELFGRSTTQHIDALRGEHANCTSPRASTKAYQGNNHGNPKNQRTGGMPQKLQRSQIFVSEFTPKHRY